VSDPPPIPSVLASVLVPTMVTPQGTTGPGKLWLVVLGPDEPTQYALPEQGELAIGRSSQCAVHVDDTSVSRRHAVVRVGAKLEVEDLGSANGTRVHGLALRPGEPYPLQPGEVVEVGSVLVVVQRRAVPRRAVRVWEHDYFEGRLEEECARAAARGGAFSLVRLGFAREPAPDELAAALGDVLGPGDVVGRYGPTDVELLLLDRAPEEAAASSARIADCFASVGHAVRSSDARFPDEGRDAARLLAKVFGPAAPPLEDDGSFENPTMRDLERLVDKVAPSDISVLILGETGVGKDVLAGHVHGKSKRASAPLLRINCAALTESLLDSELFGHEKGSFTGAAATKLGLLEAAHGGTILLDEVGDLPLATQAKLLRVLEDREVRRVGGVRGRKVDVRFLAATNLDLDAAVAAGRFRRDLYFRLAGVTISVPALRERVAEIEPLARSFVREACRAADRTELALAPAALELLRRYAWPGNVRELKNVMERAVLLCSGPRIEPEHLPATKMRATIAGVARIGAPPMAPVIREASTKPPAPPAEEVTASVRLPRKSAAPPARVKDELKELEKQRILEALEKCGGNQKEAAQKLGISRRTLLHRLDEYGVARPRKR